LDCNRPKNKEILGFSKSKEWNMFVVGRFLSNLSEWLYNAHLNTLLTYELRENTSDKDSDRVCS
jgi:hypothetical protein